MHLLNSKRLQQQQPAYKRSAILFSSSSNEQIELSTMTGEDIDGKQIAKIIRGEIKEAVQELKEVSFIFF